MTVTVTYAPDHVRTFPGLTQAEANRIVTMVSDVNDGVLPLQITVTR